MNTLYVMLLAAGEKNVDGDWIELLIPVVIIIVYAIGGILKMRSSTDKEKLKEVPETKPRYKPLDDEWQSESADRKIERDLVPPVRKQPARTSSPARPTAPEERKTLEAFLETVAPKPLAVKIAEEHAKAKARPKTPQPIWPQSSQRRQAASKRRPKVSPPAKASPVPQPAQKKAEKTSQHPALGEKLAETNELRNAIIYSEILGKPLALRDL